MKNAKVSGHGCPVLRGRTTSCGCFISFLILALILPVALPSQTGASSIENIQAVFLYNFIQYVKWEEPDTSETFDIAVIGKGAILDPLEVIAEKKTINGKKIRVRQIGQISDMDTARILFIPLSKENVLDEILLQSRDRCVIVVSEIEGAADLGAMINFVQIEGKIKFEINLRSMKNARLSPSSQLLKLATRVIE